MRLTSAKITRIGAKSGRDFSNQVPGKKKKKKKNETEYQSKRAKALGP